MTDRVTRQDLQQRMRGASVDVERAAADPRLADVPLGRADADGDGRIAGEREVDRLFALLDRHDRDDRRGSLRMRGRRGGPSPVAPKLAAVGEHAGREGLREMARVQPGPPRGDRVLYVGMNPGSGGEVQALREGGAAVRAIGSQGTDGVFRAGGRRYDLSTASGARAFARSLGVSPRRTEQIVRALLLTDVGARDELAAIARVWAGAEQGRPAPSRLVLSGHHLAGRDELFGEGNGELSVRALAALARALPHGAAAVEDLHVAACNFAHPEDVAQWREMFPNVRTIWGYDDKAPGRFRGSTDHLAHWEQASRGRRDDLRPQAVERTRKGDHVAVWSVAEGHRRNGG